MKHYLKLLLGISIGLVVSCNQIQDDAITTDIVNNPETASGEEINKENMPIMTFNEDVYDFKSAVQGEKVYHSFLFTNTGKSNLVISSAKGSCGCTVPTWPKEPIKPGEEGKIEVVFNTEGKKNTQHKRVTILANTHPNTNVIAIKGEVIAPKTE